MVLAKAQRSGSITADKAHGFLEDIRSLNITVDDESFGHISGDVHRLAVEHGLRDTMPLISNWRFARDYAWLRSTRTCRKPLAPRASNSSSLPDE